MGNGKIELPEKLAWVYLNKVLLELPEEKRVKSIETLAANPDPEFPFAVLVHISDVPEELKRKAISTIFSNNRWPCEVKEFLSQIFDCLRTLPDSLKEEVYTGALSLPDCQDSHFLEFVFDEFEEKLAPDYWKREVLKKVFDLNEYDFFHFVRNRLEKIPIDLEIKALERILGFKTAWFFSVRDYYLYSGDIIPEDLKRKAVARLAVENPQYLAAIFKDLSPDIKKQALEINHRGPQRPGNQEIFQTIGSLLPMWLVSYSGDLIFERINDIPIFRNDRWKVIDRTKEDGESEMVLLRNWNVYVLLIRDISHQNLGYAIRVPPDSKNIKDAHAYICRQDPATFDGFEREV